MKRVENSDINIKLPSGLVYINNFDAKFYTVNAKSFYITKTQNDVYPIEHDDVIEYYIKLEWDELVTIGEGVLQYQIVNNIPDYDRADGYYNKAFERTTEYYINSNVTVDEEEAESYAEIISEISDKLDEEITRSTSADTDFNEQSETISAALNDLNVNKLDASAYTPTDLTNYYTKSEVYNKSEIDNKGYITDISGKLDVSDFNTYSANTKTSIDEKLNTADFNSYSANTDGILSRYHQSIVLADQTATNANTTANEAKTIANNTFNSLTQSDWNESDSSKLSYIENKPFGETSGFVNIFADTGFSLTRCGQYNYGEMNGHLSLSENLVDGEVYKVTVNSNDFIFTATTFNTMLCLNFSGDTNVDTVAVFESKLYGGYNITIHETYLNGDTSHAAISISKSGYQLVQIDNKYINYSGDTYIQSLVTRIDNKQSTLVSGTNIKTINNQSLLGSGNITIEGGGFIKVTNPLTAATEVGLVNSLSQYYDTNIGKGAVIEGDGFEFNGTTRNIVASGTYSHSEGYTTSATSLSSHAEGFYTKSFGSYSHAEGYSTMASGLSSHAEGSGTNAIGDNSHAEGYNTITNNRSEHASGQYNVSSSASTTFGNSGNTLFSVGNGTLQTRHNAFEIRQNGDIYITSGSTDIKLQDHLGGGGSSYTAGDGIDITNDVISVTGKVDISAITTSITSSSTDSQVPSAKAVNDALQEGGGGGKAINAGTNISITTGETADTINCTLPIETISNSYGVRQIYVGDNIYKNSNYGAIVIANKDDSSTGETRVEFADDAISIGSSNKVFHNGIAIGKRATAGDQGSWNNIAIGTNVTASGSTKTNINNQIKVDTSNQVYISNSANTSTYCLQEKIENTESALGGLKLVKLTQSEYDALSTKDSNTLYVIVN